MEFSAPEFASVVGCEVSAVRAAISEGRLEFRRSVKVLINASEVIFWLDGAVAKRCVPPATAPAVGTAVVGSSRA